VRKLLVDADLRLKFLKKLRAMNIHRASLFPGLDGFGRSLKLNGQEKTLLNVLHTLSVMLNARIGAMSVKE
jgi:hypothetical protein